MIDYRGSVLAVASRFAALVVCSCMDCDHPNDGVYPDWPTLFGVFAVTPR